MNEISNDDRDVPGGPMVRTVLPKLGAEVGVGGEVVEGLTPGQGMKVPSSTAKQPTLKKFFFEFFKKVKSWEK